MNRRAFVTALGLTPFARAVRATPDFAGGVPRGRAEHCIFIWLGGGMGQIDTFDPKALGDNQATKKKPGALYPSIETSVPGVRVRGRRPRPARPMEPVAGVRSGNPKAYGGCAFARILGPPCP